MGKAGKEGRVAAEPAGHGKVRKKAMKAKAKPKVIDREPDLQAGSAKEARDGASNKRKQPAGAAAARASSPERPPPRVRKAGGGLYKTGDVILLAGEGDLSFACSLLERLRGSAYIVATVFDSAKALRRKYPEAWDNVKRLSAAGMMVKFGVDCRSLHKVKDFDGAFTKVIFNFPHLGSDDAGVTEHQALLRDFLSSAAQCLERIPSAEIHITLKSGDPYKAWQCASMAKLVGGGEVLRCDRELRFDASHYPGYQHRRTRGHDYEMARGLNDGNVLAGARTHVFKLRKEMLDPGETPGPGETP